jgi:putative SOS response-associated peptidase YedK
MCGRFKLDLKWKELVRLYRLVNQVESGSLPLGEVRPTDQVPVILPGQSAVWMRWGWPMMWVARDGKDPWRSQPLINTRIEEAPQKPTWANAWRTRRCLVPMSGFLEWETRGREKIPNLFSPTTPVAFGALWAEFLKEGEPIPCVSILTRAANAVVSPIHDRMPVLLEEAQWETWLDPHTPLAALSQLAAGLPEDRLRREAMLSSAPSLF